MFTLGVQIIVRIAVALGLVLGMQSASAQTISSRLLADGAEMQSAVGSWSAFDHVTGASSFSSRGTERLTVICESSSQATVQVTVRQAVSHSAAQPSLSTGILQ